MIDLQLLGGLVVDRPGRAPGLVASRRHSLALLALVAAAAPQPIARDKLMALLWPESDAARASNSLRQTLFGTRRGLGDDVFLPESAAGLQLDPGRVTVDLWAFRDALERGAPDEAVRVYRGPFLDGFAIPRAAEFARWVETERDLLTRQHLGALDALARQAAEAGHHNDAVAWRRRQAAADPFSSRVALALLKALVNAGDRPGALEYASVYENAVRLHLDIEPDPAVAEFVASLRREYPAAEAARSPEKDRPSRAPVEPPTPTAAAPVVTSAAGESEGPMGHSFGRGRLWQVAAAAATVVAAAVALWAVEKRAAEGGTLDGGPLVAYRAHSAHTAGCADRVPEANRYALVYALSIPEDANYQDGFPPYSVDHSKSIGPFDRVAYCLELDDQWVWVSMDAFSHVAAHLGVPVAATGATFQQAVSDMNVFSNVPGVATGTGIATGSVEFWHHCYDETNAVGLPGASSTLNDFDDLYPHPRYAYDSCYGSMQVHNRGARQTVFAYNQWDRDPELNTGPDDLGIGNSPVGIHPDWTFEANAGRYRARTLSVLARIAGSADPR